MHATLDGAVAIQGAYQKRVELGLDPKNSPSQAGMEAVFHMLKSWRTFRYKRLIEEIEENDSYGDLLHFVRVVETTSPTVAASVFYGIGKYTGEEDIVGATLNVIPLDAARTVVAVSCLRQHEANIHEEHQQLFRAEGHYFKYLASKLLLKRGENFVINPAYFDLWSEEKRNKIREYFIATMLDEEYEEESEDLYLF
jgi:hypothetical protein